MINKTEEILHGKTRGLNKPKTYVLTINRFNTYMVLYISDLNRAQIYKMPLRDSSHLEIEKILSFNYSNLFKPNEHTEDYHVKKTKR